MLWTEFFPFLVWPKCGARTRIHNLPYGPEQTRLIRCLLYGFVDYSGFEEVIKSYGSVRLLTDLELTNHSTRNQSAI